MLSVIFSHKKTQEREHLRQLFAERAWFARQNFFVFLPSQQADVEKEIEKNKLPREELWWLNQEWKKVEPDFFRVIKKFKHKKLLPKYYCHVSRFGPEGKYFRPNKLIVRLRTKRDRFRVTETIGHELIHLILGDFFALKKLSYAEREGMVDALVLHSDLAGLFPEYQKQSIGKIRPKLLQSILG